MAQGQIQALVCCGPSGSGKSTLLRKLFAAYPDKFGFSVSHTTRAPRPKEVDGVHYHFTTKEAIQASIDNGEFIEFAVFSDNIYGTSKKAVENVFKEGKLCVLDVNIDGVRQIKKSDIKALYVFLKPPSIEELAKRLKQRGTETEETLEKRLNAAKEEILFGETPNNFDLVIENNNIEEAYAILKNFVFEQLTKFSEHGDAIK